MQANLATKNAKKPPQGPKDTTTNEEYEEDTSLYTNDAFVSFSPSHIILLSTTIPANKNTWILDSGATDHCTTELSDFQTYHPLSTPQQINGICCKAIGKGNVCARFQNSKGKNILITIKDVIYVPNLKDRSTLNTCRLLSLSRLQHNSKGQLHFTTGAATITLPSGNTILISSPPDSHLYYVISKIMTNEAISTTAAFPAAHKHSANTPAATNASPHAKLLHDRLGHQGHHCLQRTAQNTGLPVGKKEDILYYNS